MIVLIFWCFSAPPNPTELVSISADGRQRRTRRKRERSEVEKQNKFSDKMPEAERLCRRTGSPLSSCRTEERIFKRRQKQRASPLTGKRADGDAVSQHASRSDSSVRMYSFIFIPCYCRKVCGSPDNTTVCVRVQEIRQLIVSVKNILPNCLLPAACVHKCETLQILLITS